MKPILFNTPMTQAIQEDRKTVTRRVIKPQPDYFYNCVIGNARPVTTERYGAVMPDKTDQWIKPPYHPSDILWVRETWQKWAGEYHYKADYNTGRDVIWTQCDSYPRWRPSIHMPKEAARLFLRVEAVRVERLQDITEEQAAAEGAYRAYPYTEPGTGKTVYARDERATYRGGFSAIWKTTIKPADLPLYGWEANPWVWVIKFGRVSKEAALGGGGDG